MGKNVKFSQTIWKIFSVSWLQLLWGLEACFQIHDFAAVLSSRKLVSAEPSSYKLCEGPIKIDLNLNPYYLFVPLYSRILALEKLGAVFNQVATPLRYTPRKFVIHPRSNNLIIIESDHNAFTDTVREEKKQQIAEVCDLFDVWRWHYLDEIQSPLWVKCWEGLFSEAVV